MTKIRYKIFGGEAEIVSASADSGVSALFSFDEPVSGFLSIDGVVAAVSSGEAIVDIRLISDGEYTPILILRDGSISLPAIRKSGKYLTPAACSDGYVRGISLRERYLEARVKLLEEELEMLKKHVYGTKIL